MSKLTTRQQRAFHSFSETEQKFLHNLGPDRTKWLDKRADDEEKFTGKNAEKIARRYFAEVVRPACKKAKMDPGTEQDFVAGYKEGDTASIRKFAEELDRRDGKADPEETCERYFDQIAGPAAEQAGMPADRKSFVEANKDDSEAIRRMTEELKQKDDEGEETDGADEYDEEEDEEEDEDEPRPILADSRDEDEDEEEEDQPRRRKPAMPERYSESQRREYQTYARNLRSAGLSPCRCEMSERGGAKCLCHTGKARKFGEVTGGKKSGVYVCFCSGTACRCHPAARRA